MKMKKLLAVLLATAMVLVFVACGTNNTGNNAVNNNNISVGDADGEPSVETVKIGLVIAVTGPNSLAGEQATEGAQLAVDQINAAGGVNGQQLELVITDEVDNLEMSVLATQELLSNNEISAIIGSIYSSYCIAAMPSVAEVGMPYISMGGSVGVSEEQNPYTWQVRPLDSALGVILADFAVNTLGCSKPAIMHSTQSTFASEAEHLIAAFEENGVEITDANIFAFPEEESNYTPYISQILDGDFDCAIALANQAPAAIICQQAQAAGLTSEVMPLIGSASFCTSVCITNAGEASNGWYSVSDWLPGGNNDTGAAFEKAYLAANPNRTSSDLNSACVYDGVYVIAEAMKIAGSTTDREAINEAMKEIDFEGCISHFSYYEDHSFANMMNVTQNVDGKVMAVDVVTYR